MHKTSYLSKNSFLPDTPLVAGIRLSPNANVRCHNSPVEMLVLHYTGMRDAEAALTRLCDAKSQVSAHYVVDEVGRTLQLVPEALRAWHAGIAVWRGLSDINSRSIGIEIVNPGHEFGLTPYPDAQIDAVIALARDIVTRHEIAPRDVVGHSDIAPQRKQDPGELFPWARLANAGVGIWPAVLDRKRSVNSTMPILKYGMIGHDVAELRRALTAFGYALLPADIYNMELACVVRAFQRRFRPACVDGEADADTLCRLDAVLAACTEP